MAIKVEDVIYLEHMSDKSISKIIETANNVAINIKDRSDLHNRDYLERFINVTMGEIAEMAVINWLKRNNKYAESAIDKTSPNPDPGHDIILKSKDGNEILCSVKSSLSAKKPLYDILEEFTLATKKSELRDVNIQVYFWLNINVDRGSRTTVPSTKNCAIIGWAGKNDIKTFGKYATEDREAPKTRLKELRPMIDLLKYIE